MHVQVRLFAMQRAQTGRSRVSLELPEGADVATAWAALVADFPELAPAQTSVRFARNGRYVDATEQLAPGDELAVIPPVAGGAAGEASAPEGPGPQADDEAVASGERRRHLAIVDTPLGDELPGELCRRVSTSADGAVALFVGQTRDSPGTPAPGQEAEAVRVAGQLVRGLTYEAFEPMALAVLDEIADEIEARFGVRRVAIVHRVGDVAVGEVSVAIAVASSHREEAFAACRYAIEELKARAPIWKVERFADGSVWLGAPARHGPGDEPGMPDVPPRPSDEAG
jgi:molybdopterin synthase catalytic subunit